MDNPEEKRDVRFSAVIPTWNEEEWLPGLLSNLRRFSQITEIIVADNDSGDQTRRIARLHGARVVAGGYPAAARNEGSKYATSDYILFIDADAAVSAPVLKKAAEAFADDQNVAVHFPLAPIDSSSSFFKVCYFLMNAYVRTLSIFGIAQGTGTFLAVRKDAFHAARGFDESIGPGEDADFLRRVSRQGRVRYERSALVGTSTRRFHLENPLIFMLKTCGWALLRLVQAHFLAGRYTWKTYPSGLGSRERALYVDFIREQEAT